jgi:signal transduction histidine kinase
MRSKDRMMILALASHELRGPAGIIRGYLRLVLSDHTLTERQRKSIGDADRATDKLVGVLDEMNEYARFLRGHQKLERRMRSLRSIIVQATQVVQPPVEPAVQLDVIADVDVQANVDEVRVRAALAAIIHAVCRSQTTATTVDVTLSEATSGRRKSSIIDIAPRSLSRSRLTSRAPDFTRPGLGLALPVADAVIRAHGGRLVERWASARWAGYRVAGLK